MTSPDNHRPFWGTTTHSTVVHLFVWDEGRKKMVPACMLHRMSRPVPKRVFPVDGCHKDHPGACPDCAKRSMIYLPVPVVSQKSSKSSIS